MVPVTPTIWLASAGFVATAISFGPARMGFGLFLPTFREAFDLSTTQAGFIASLGFLAFLAALPMTAWLGTRVGQRVPVVLGAGSAALGFALVAGAQGSTGLAAGIALAGASAGFCWAPFNDAAERVVSPAARPSALSAIATGTTVGVGATGALYLGVTVGAFDWRLVWGMFAALGLAGAIVAMRGVPGGRVAERARTTDTRGFLRRDVAPLYGAALCFGISNAVYLAFAADHVVASGGLDGLPDEGAAAMIFLSYGICGLAGLTTGRLEAWIGLVALLGVIFAAFTGSLVLLALWPGGWGAVLASAGLHGAAVMMISAILSFWSLRLFPGRGSLGFTAALIGVAVGSVAGPAVMGVLADATSLRGALLATAAAPLLATIGFATRVSRRL
ncbi:MAG: MFS transporter [Rhodobacteraceae bacterium]|nr:MAG: MFS transporter [Paracoccaceae bacterium]